MSKDKDKPRAPRKLTELTGEELYARYREEFARRPLSVMKAGLIAGEFIRRGYILVEGGNGKMDLFERKGKAA